MKFCFRRPEKRSLFILLVSLAVIPVAIIILWAFGIIFTYTGSIPIGFYHIVSDTGPIQQGDIVSFCLPDKIAKMGLKRSYLDHGLCPNGSEELIKEVIAVPGDTVILTGHQMIVNHIGVDSDYFAPTHVIDKDHLLVHRFIKKGIYQAKGYWVYGFGAPLYSWDSRYYGGIPKSNITHRLVPLWLF